MESPASTAMLAEKTWTATFLSTLAGRIEQVSLADTALKAVLARGTKEQKVAKLQAERLQFEQSQVPKTKLDMETWHSDVKGSLETKLKDMFNIKRQIRHNMFHNFNNLFSL